MLCTAGTSETMNYVGQLAGHVVVQVRELYRGLNPATLSGCIDVIVVRRADGSMHCSPFHVRFGKLGVLRSREKLVDIEVNGEPVSLHMKLGDNGEAFFVEETENDQEVVPSYLVTSPISSDAETLVASCAQTPGAGGGEGGGMGKKRRKRRRKSRVDSTKRETSAGSSGDDDVFSIDTVTSGGAERGRTSSRDEVVNAGCSTGSYKHIGVYAHSDGDWTPIHSPNVSRPCSPKSDSELVTKAGEGRQQDPAMQWAWGELPQPSFLPSKPEPAATSPVSIPVSNSTHFRVIPNASATKELHHGNNSTSPQLFIPTVTAAEGAGPECLKVKAQPMRTDLDRLSAGTEDIAVGKDPMRAYNGPNGQDPGPMRIMDAEMTAMIPAHVVAEVEAGRVVAMETHPQNKTDSPTKRKDKRSRHLGSDGVYLDDITELEPEVAALYFPKSGTGRACENTGRRGNTSPQSVGSSDSGVDSHWDQPTELLSVTLSLCGGLTDSRDINKEHFQEKVVSYHQFSANPALIEDPNLVLKIGAKYYNWSTAAPILLAMQVFQKPLPKATVDSIVKEKMPRKSGRWWFSWRGRGNSTKPDAAAVNGSPAGTDHTGKMAAISRRKDESSSSDEDHLSAMQSASFAQSDPVLPQGGVSYRKTLRLSAEQLAGLQLKEGPNDVVFSVTTQYQGTCRCEGTIYLWNWNDKIIISDIDGTITRSDTLGHILPTLGKDWTHQGIARLFHKVSQNGYKFMYCSARAIGMAGMTRGYLHWVNESGTMLPQGPVLLSPSSLFSALHREVIEKKPEKFKVECLTDIKNLFYPNTQPFYAAFGNRATDVYSYKEVGVSLNRIFTVNPKGELVQEHAKTNVSSYARLGEVVDHVFPLVKRSSSSDFPCSDTYSQFTFWREQIPMVDSQDSRKPSS